ncbi:hypothetical protein BLA29_009630 [Euroglyphus maynei]|uniref:Uncharacterized protein n=1 Tax=Euroglyphus maynei TaxID=6958 RepID=A0A1Y3B9A6_EURMA|nr:hypothetical protein BLA29_009630 [Euroglyphus maynei]
MVYKEKRSYHHHDDDDIEIDLEITRSDVEEHKNSGYTNPYQCWCTAYGGHHQIMSRKASNVSPHTHHLF